ncbi:MAG TPA: polyprenyl synthetase family protein, partial [Victivallales bacterium]|nr:polyprenyl synthetase family protein [Victivallales bacterium]
PALLMWTCGLFGGQPESAKLAGAAVEIFHNWTLVHDDIIDCDPLRKGEASTHISIANFAKSKGLGKGSEAENFGVSQSILTGDIQHAWAINMLLKTHTRAGISSDTVLGLTKDLCLLGGRDLICGESLDVEISYKKWSQISVEELLKIAEMKTGRLLEFSAICGARIACDGKKTDDRLISRIGDFAKFAGIAFQLKDDWLGVFADEKTIGKPALSDLSERKPTYLFLETIRLSGKKESEFIISRAGKRNFSAKDIVRIREIVKGCGAEESCLSKASKMKTESLKMLQEFPEGKFKSLLVEWADHVIERGK